MKIHSGRSLAQRIAALALIAALLSPLTHASPLPPGIHASRPCSGPPATELPLSRSVDAFADAIYTLDFGSEGGSLSKWLQLRYPDGVTLYLILDDIGDEPLDAAGVLREAVDGARVCDGGRVFPRRMNRSTTPRLWALKREVLRIQDDYNAEFILGHAFPAVFSILAASATLGGPPPPASRRSLPGVRLVPGRTASEPTEPTTQEPPSQAVEARPGTMKGGGAYDRLNRFNYPYRELLIDQPDGSRGRLDGYNPLGGGQIVSRKFTQLADVQEETALGYVRELATKYRPGYRIAHVPSSGPLAGRRLAGRQILEVPIQLRPIPKAVLDLAQQLKITIRDVTGRIYE
ncbi:MAG TPA: hypothetical protein VH877_01190 [Polyangia bacterium]|jgi:hypothetical protein|nr:hypothetical protein [Polyangia bacterium]